ncbi:hypothetical protein D9M70_441710 [compost metagenome]
MLHGAFHARQAYLPGAGQPGRLLGGAGHLMDGAHQVARGGRDLARGGADLRGGGGGLGGGGLLLARGGGNLVDRGGDLDRGALRLAHQRGQLAGHLVEAFLDLQELVLAAQRHAQAQVAATHAGEQADDRLHRHGDRTQQQVAAHHGHHQRDDQRGLDADLGRVDGVVDAARGACIDRAVVVDQVLGRLARGDPAIMHVAAQGRYRGRAVPVAGLDQHLCGLFILGAQVAVGLEGDPVVAARDRGLVLLLQLVQAQGRILALLLEAAPLGVAGGIDGLPGKHVAFAPDAADAGAVVQPRQRVMQHQRGFALDRVHPRIGDHAHQGHDQQDHGKACQDAGTDGPSVHGEGPGHVLVQGGAGRRSARLPGAAVARIAASGAASGGATAGTALVRGRVL